MPGTIIHWSLAYFGLVSKIFLPPSSFSWLVISLFGPTDLGLSYRSALVLSSFVRPCSYVQCFSRKWSLVYILFFCIKLAFTSKSKKVTNPTSTSKDSWKGVLVFLLGPPYRAHFWGFICTPSPTCRVGASNYAKYVRPSYSHFNDFPQFPFKIYGKQPFLRHTISQGSTRDPQN